MPPQTDIIDFEAGLAIAIRSGTQSLYGQILRVTDTRVDVKLPTGEVRRFSRTSRFEIGSQLTKYTRPYICTVARARDADREYAAATARARENLRAKGLVS